MLSVFCLETSALAAHIAKAVLVRLTCLCAMQKPAVEQAAKAREIHRDEVAKHRSSKSVWVTYKDGVYDVTEFAAQHPGGAARLMLAAGGAIDPFWAMYAQHQTAEVRQLLEQYRIGTLVRHQAAMHGCQYRHLCTPLHAWRYVCSSSMLHRQPVLSALAGAGAVQQAPLSWSSNQACGACP